jgi:hypothetical protein
MKTLIQIESILISTSINIIPKLLLRLIQERKNKKVGITFNLHHNSLTGSDIISVSQPYNQKVGSTVLYIFPYEISILALSHKFE